MIGDKDRSMNLRNIPYRIAKNKEQLNGIAGYLHNCYKSKGRYPTNDEGLTALAERDRKTVEEGISKGLSFEAVDALPQVLEYPQVEMGIAQSIWGEPFIYENREGLDPLKFADSGANRDPNLVYSICVDKDVYVWSLGAEQDYHNYRIWHPLLVTARIIVILVSLSFFGLYVAGFARIIGARYAHRSKIGRRLRVEMSVIGGALVWVLIAFMVSMPFFSTCYRIGFFHSRPGPELEKKYLHLITQYHERGIISDSAYRKLTETVK